MQRWDLWRAAGAGGWEGSPGRPRAPQAAPVTTAGRSGLLCSLSTGAPTWATTGAIPSISCNTGLVQTTWSGGPVPRGSSRGAAPAGVQHPLPGPCMRAGPRPARCSLWLWGKELFLWPEVFRATALVVGNHREHAARVSHWELFLITDVLALLHKPWVHVTQKGWERPERVMSVFFHFGVSIWPDWFRVN